MSVGRLRCVAWLERGGGALVGEAWGGLGRGGVVRASGGERGVERGGGALVGEAWGAGRRGVGRPWAWRRVERGEAAWLERGGGDEGVRRREAAWLERGEAAGAWRRAA